MTVKHDSRHLRKRPCPVYGGGADDPRGKDKRCFGWTSEDGAYAHCTREELAGNIPPDPSGTSYAHRLHGSCKCGQTHGAALNGAAEVTKSGAKSDNREEPDATYVYKDEKGKPLFQVLRYPGKRFRQRAYSPSGFVWSLSGVRRVLYRLPELLEDESDRPVYIVEGEKDVDALHARGHLATCNPGGAGKWGAVADHARTVLQKRDVIIVADADKVGREHAAEIAESLGPDTNSTQLRECPAPYKDVFALLVEGKGSLDQLVELGTSKEPSAAQQMAPALPFDELWTPEPDAHLVMPGLGIAPGPTHLVTGTWYTGKTLLLATMGLSVAAGKWLFGLHQTKRAKWVHFDHEMGRRHMKRYLQRLRAGMGIELDELRGQLEIRVLPRLNLRTPGAFEMYCELLDGYGIATIDPLRAAAPGADENKSEFREHLDMLAQVSDRTRCSIVVLHHGGKPGPVESDRRDMGRGSSAINDSVQSKWVLSAEEKGAPMLVTHEKTRELVQLMDDFYLRIDSTADSVKLVHMNKEEMGQTIEKAKSDRELANLTKAKIRIRELFRQHAGRLNGVRDDVIRMVGGDRGVMQRALSEMLTTLEIKRETRREGSQIATTFVWDCDKERQ